MGAINYGYNEFFNIGVNPENYWIENENSENEFLDFEMQWDYEQIENILNKYNFEYFTVTVESGYYEGFYINIKFDLLWVECYEKPLILKELTLLKKFLLECCSYGLVKYSAGWCMSYYTKTETEKAIAETIKTLKEQFKHLPTYNTYRKEQLAKCL